MTLMPSEKVNFITHGLGALLWIPLTAFLMFVVWGHWDLVLVSFIYGLGAIFMFGASTLYHKFKKAENEKTLLRSLDHFAIFVMIAGSYTPVAYVWFLEPTKWITLGSQWGITLLGLFLTFFVRNRPRWIDVVLYLSMGWVSIFLIKWMMEIMSPTTLGMLLAGGIFYSVGALIYALKKPNWKPGVFGFHELFHLFILAGAVAHFFLVYETLLHGLTKV